MLVLLYLSKSSQLDSARVYKNDWYGFSFETTKDFKLNRENFTYHNGRLNYTLFFNTIEDYMMSISCDTMPTRDLANDAVYNNNLGIYKKITTKSGLTGALYNSNKELLEEAFFNKENKVCSIQPKANFGKLDTAEEKIFRLIMKSFSMFDGTSSVDDPLITHKIKDEKIGYELTFSQLYQLVELNKSLIDSDLMTYSSFSTVNGYKQVYFTINAGLGPLGVDSRKDPKYKKQVINGVEWWVSKPEQELHLEYISNAIHYTDKYSYGISIVYHDKPDDPTKDVSEWASNIKFTK